MSKSKKTSEYAPATLKTIADFLVEDYRFCRSFESAIKKVDNEELKKRYLSSYAFHSDRIKEFVGKAHLQIIIFDGVDYDEGLPVTPLNADEFTYTDNLLVTQTIEPTILNADSQHQNIILHQGTAILSKKQSKEK